MHFVVQTEVLSVPGVFQLAFGPNLCVCCQKLCCETGDWFEMKDACRHPDHKDAVDVGSVQSCSSVAVFHPVSI